ncbi:MAG: response regulator [Rubrivivax sp.]|nr:response regulator [Rubrivivax sp.]
MSAVASHSAGRKGKILVVDDDRLVLATVMHGLSSAGYEVIDADNGDDAILLARQHRPDLALLDIRMDGKTGFDVAEYLREVGHTPFVFLSAFSDEATVAKVTQLGALAYLVKPLEVGQIVPAVDAAFERARTQAQNLAPAERADPAQDEAADALSQPVALAVGALMHRFSQTRGEALARLRRHAAAEGRSLRAQAERVVQAIEDLASPEG